MNKKQTYTSPEVQVFVVQIEDCILTVPSPTNDVFNPKDMSGSWSEDD